MTDAVIAPRRPWILGIFLLVAGAAGWWAAFQLTLDKFIGYEHPNTKLSCDFGFIVQCTANLNSPEGSAFGFPNPIIGLGGFAAVIAVGVSLLAGARFARWYWILFNLGVAGALVFVIFLITKSIFHLGTLCPWCMVVWSATIPLFFAVTIRNLAEGVYGEPTVRVGRALRPWIVPITVISYLIVALIAQLQLNVLSAL
ncbi:MAG TPA: vitamin K epoxide reductase family protein [Pseudolysinimonas sp.]|nr:vitamin K epoxide reductase family protein [Pseudolysinimonas sp.]